MADKTGGCCGHGEQESCAVCRGEEIFSYWCKSCKRSVPDKRCPYCGLKAQMKKGTEPT